MKTFLLTVALFAAVACAAPKSKRDVSHLLKNGEYLPPDHHHHHEHHHHEANVQQSQYVAPQPQLNNQYLAPVAKAPQPQKQSLQLPAATYGVPFKAAPAPAPVSHAPVAHNAPVNSYGAPVVQAQAAPQVHYAPAPAPVPHTTYGVPQQYQQQPQQHYKPQPQYQQPQQHYQQPQQHYQQPQQHYQQPQQHYQQPQQHYQQPQQHYQPQPQYQQPQPQYQQPQQQHYHQAPQPVPHQTYGVPVVHQAPAPIVHQAPAPVVHQAPQPQYSAPAPAERLVFEAPVPSIEVSQSHSVERAPSTPIVSAPVSAPEHNHDAVSIEAIGKSTEVHQHYNQQHVASNGGYVY